MTPYDSASHYYRSHQYQPTLSPFASAGATWSSTPATQALSSSGLHQPYSCLQCKHRKVRCDRADPCANCSKAGAECIYRAPPPPRRRKRVHQDRSTGRTTAVNNEIGNDVTERERALLAKVRRYESLLKDLGALKRLSVAGDAIAPSAPDSIATGDGKLIAKSGKSKYLENNLWTSVTDEFYDPNDILDESSEHDDDEDDFDAESDTAVRSNQEKSYAVRQDPADLIFHAKRMDGVPDLASMHPQPMQIFILWQTYVDNVNPLIKILHVPTAQKAVLDAAADLRHVSRGLEALLFGIYVIAVSSMDEDQCRSTLHESKSSALDKFRTGAQQALRAAALLKTSDMMVLQAFVLYLLSVRPHYDAHSLWSLTGISIRIGQRIGLHRDGETLELSPFETEMRRRLWINIVQLDSRAAELSGSGLSIVSHLWDTKPPLNVNDCDLYPDMREPPLEEDRGTEMMFLLLRAQIGIFLTKGMPRNYTFDGSWSKLSNPAVSVAEKDRAIDELEQILEQKFVRHCDPQIPLHCMSSLIAKAAICKIRLFAHLPRVARGSLSSDPSSPSPFSGEEDLLFANSIRMLQFDSQIRTDQSLRRFLWHVERHFQWHALIYLLTYLRTHANPDPHTDSAWITLDQVFANHPEIIFGGRKRSKLCVAVGNLALRAWEAREIKLRTSNLELSSVPSWVGQLRGQIVTPDRNIVIQPLQNLSLAEEGQGQQEFDLGALRTDGVDGFSLGFTSNDNSGEPAPETHTGTGMEMHGMDTGSVDWEQWDSMCQEFEIQDQWGDAFTPVDTFPQQ
ncbi:hypothetical protein GGR54DRAFT_414278 [Hypoxylon sp. NC1633]|nr:hypothetical protein GGR54DRAFT_414278 [Hypoxylon sp. NC1633]